ncbi:pyrimidine utilization protein D [Pseudomonas syringae]|nr:pyrimidine utilization protein D [Pseudomonas syringae]MBD8789849.1 pyrimidine utilization protein D [Pseudomonas syringae]MBD8799824.1 pyrimidine utilization protein D [Pseudomonas syringae]MBD8811180.1 pyrimidine utilization protein D [Pseudomonas syringae]
MRLYTEVHGPADAEAVLLSSGLGGSAGYWSVQIPALVAAGYKVIAYDQRGTGRSAQALPDGYRIEHMADDVQAVLEATQTERCHLIGHALGGLVGLQLALDAPTRVRSLTLINAWSQPNPHSARCFEARLGLLDALGPRAYVEAQPIFLYPASWCVAHAGQVQAEVEHACAHFPGAATLKARIGALRAFDVAQRLSEIRVPTLVSTARDDVLVPWTCSQYLAQHLPHATLHTVDHGAHAHNLTAADDFNAALLSFLAAQPTAEAMP